MQEGPLDDWVDERIVQADGKPAEVIDQARYFCTGRERVEDSSRTIDNPDLIIVPGPALIGRTVEFPAGDHCREGEEKSRLEVAFSPFFRTSFMVR